MQTERSIANAPRLGSPSGRRARVRLGTARFGVVIPALDEATGIAAAVRSVRDEPRVAEVVVVDGGSSDATLEVARRAGARVLRAPRGRGQQMNRGAAQVQGESLVFLHADCRLPPRAFDAMLDVFDQGYDAGLFAVDYGVPHPILSLVSRLSGWRSAWTEFGEGALFVRRACFERLGGFPDWPLFEDVDLLGRLRRLGTLGRAPGAVRASPRRFERRGVVRQLLLNSMLFGLYHLGVSPHRLARLYDSAAD